jgi:hypothetical protein
MAFTKPVASAHFEQARLNFRLYRQLCADAAYVDWALVLLFYSALQLIQAHLVETAASGFDIPHGHDKRRAEIQRRLAHLWDFYWRLDNASMKARYRQDLCPDPTSEEVEVHYREDFLPILNDLRAKHEFLWDT